MSAADPYDPSSSMLWIIVSVASVFVVATAILGFLIYQRRQARLRLLAQQGTRRNGSSSGDGSAPRAVTEIELEEAESLPYVERVDEEPNSPAYPVAQSLTVVSRGPSRASSFASLRRERSLREMQWDGAASGASAGSPTLFRTDSVRSISREDVVGDDDHIPVALTTAEVLGEDAARDRSCSCSSDDSSGSTTSIANSVDSLGSFGDGEPHAAAASPSQRTWGHASMRLEAEAVAAASAFPDGHPVQQQQHDHRGDRQADYDFDDDEYHITVSGDDDELQLARVLSLSMQAYHQSGAPSAPTGDGDTGGGGGGGHVDACAGGSGQAHDGDADGVVSLDCVVIDDAASDGESSSETENIASDSDTGGGGGDGDAPAWP
jgi:hypothetical protein